MIEKDDWRLTADPVPGREKNLKKRLWRRMVALLLIGGLLIVCGCTDTSPKQTEEKETVAPQKSELLDTAEKVVAYVEEMAQAGAEEFTLVCSEEVYNVLVKVTYKTDRGERKAYHSLLDQAGLYDYRAVTAAVKRTITVSDVSFYPGYEILRSVKAGTEAELTSELRETLAEARAMAEACKAADPLETAKNIQSAICEKTIYGYMTNQSHVDTAMGVLLEGVADCDGYADAFYLVGGLAGLDIRYQHGISSQYDLEENQIVTGSHMWNLLKLDGSWRVVDVCWADGENGIDYSWFNIGMDRASRSRTWQEDLSVPLLETTDLSTRPETEYSVTNREELETAIREATEKGQAAFTIIFDNDSYGSRTEAFDMLWNYYSGEIYYYWDECSRVLTMILEDAAGG